MKIEPFLDKNIIKEKTLNIIFEINKPKFEGIVLKLDKEYEIFNEPSMPGVKVLTRYDTWDEDRTIEDWIEYC
jgi:hypothetical protein